MTNIWAWVQQRKQELGGGEPDEQRLAELMRALPSAVVDEAHERVDALVPEALALARDLDEPWVELFVRHWWLQSRVLHRRQAGDELREAVSLLDFASGPRAKACPQSVCAVQDLAVCYAIRDGPGYVDERLAVARETLARIDPSWACFDCISAEYVSALLDDQRPAEALAFLDAQIERLAEHGEFEPPYNIVSNRASALLALGRPAEALELHETLRERANAARARQMSWRLQRVELLLALDRVDEALALHPPLSAIRATASHFGDWVSNFAALIERGRIANEVAVGHALLEIQRRLEANGARWGAAKTALVGARLALARGAREATRRLLHDYDAIAPGLRRPARLARDRAALAEALAAADRAALEPEPEPAPHDGEPAPGESSEATAERALDRLADRRRAGEVLDERETVELAAALRAIGRAEQARALLEATASLTNLPALVELARALLAERDHAALDRLIAPIEVGLISGHGVDDDAARRALVWTYGESLRERGDLDRAIAFDRALLAEDPGLLGVWRRLAANARARGSWDIALLALDVVVGHDPPGPSDWDRMTAATVLGRWATVRAAAARLGLRVPGAGDEPIDAHMGLIRCEFVEASGRRERYWARRTSPCAATIIEIAMPAAEQHFRDRVVFEPVDLDASLGRDDDAERHRCYEAVAVLEPGRQRAFVLRGFDPGLDQVEALRVGVRAAGYGFERITSPGRVAADPRVDGAPDGPEPEPTVPTIAVLVALGLDEPADRLRQRVRELTAGWELPLLDPKLDLAAGEPAAATESARLLTRWKP